MTQANASGKVRRGAGLLALICFLVLAGLGIRHVVHQPYFDIHHIEVTGDTSFTNVGALEKTLWEKLNGNYFFADLDPMRAAVEEVPWVASAKVERLWPDTIRVEIEKRRPIAIWGGTRLISDRGEIFAPKNLDTPEAQGLPSFSGLMPWHTKWWRCTGRFPSQWKTRREDPGPVGHGPRLLVCCD